MLFVPYIEHLAFLKSRTQRYTPQRVSGGLQGLHGLAIQRHHSYIQASGSFRCMLHDASSPLPFGRKKALFKRALLAKQSTTLLTRTAGFDPLQ